jgi:hypothetical protein
MAAEKGVTEGGFSPARLERLLPEHAEVMITAIDSDAVPPKRVNIRADRVDVAEK